MEENNLRKAIVAYFDDKEGIGVLHDKISKKPIITHFSVIKNSKHTPKTLNRGEEVLFASVLIEGKEIAKEVWLNVQK